RIRTESGSDVDGLGHARLQIHQLSKNAIGQGQVVYLFAGDRVAFVSSDSIDDGEISAGYRYLLRNGANFENKVHARGFGRVNWEARKCCFGESSFLGRQGILADGHTEEAELSRFVGLRL